MTNKQISKIVENEYEENKLRVCEFVEKEKEETAQKVKRITNIFNKEDSQALFKKSSTTVKEGLYTETKDLIFYPLNLEYLKRIGVEVEFLRSHYQQSEDEMEMLYTEYYLCKESACIIFVQYHFRHIVLFSENNRTNLKTSVFVNSQSEIFCYNEFFGKKFLKQFDANMGVDNAKEVLLKKQFQAYPAEDREYVISSSKNPEIVEKREMSEMHLVVKQLLDLFLQGVHTIPSSEQLRIETNFLGSSEKQMKVATKLKDHYQEAGTIERMQHLLEYEIILYFLNNPEKRVVAKFYLTQAEKEEYFIMTEEDLEEAVLIDLKWTELCKKQRYKEYYQRYCNNKERKEGKRRVYIQNDIAKMMLQVISMKENCYEHPLLKDSFQKIYIETFEVLTQNLAKEYSIKPIRKQRVTCENGEVSQSYMYSILYENTTYLVEIFSIYEAYWYRSLHFEIYLPALGVSYIRMRILKPTNKSEIERFVKGEETSSDKVLTYTYDRGAFTFHKYNQIFLNNKWKEIFPNFKIQIKIEGKQGNYEIKWIDTKKIYEKILKCINSSGTQTTRFTVESPFRMCDSDDEVEMVKVPVTSNDIPYAVYMYELNDIMMVNCPFGDYEEHCYSTGDDLLEIELESKCYKTMFYAQMSLMNSDCFREKKVTSQEIWKLCVDFLLDKQEEL